MSIKGWYLILFLSIISTVARGQDSLWIKGRVIGNYEGNIYLRLMAGNQLVEVKNGKFEIRANLEQPILSHFRTSGEKFYTKTTPLFLENRAMELVLKADFDSNTNTLSLIPEKVRNAPLHDKFVNFNLTLANIAKASPDKETRVRKSRELLYEVMNSEASPSLKAAILHFRNNLLHPDSLVLLASRLPSDINPIIPEDYTAKKNVVGQKLVDFSIPDSTGNNVSLSSLKSPYLLIDFWASWCGPCRLENRKLKEIYQHRQKTGLEIVSVSLDSNRKQWIKAMNQDNMPWLQLSDLKGYEATIAKHYQVGSIPDNLLLDKDGTIIARGISSEQLEKLLNK